MSNTPLTASEIAQRIRAGQLSSEQAVRACLDRIEARESAVGAWIWIDPEQALRAARAADQARGSGAPLGPLHGVPVGAKDIIDTFDMPTGLGFAPYAERRPNWDAACVAACRKAGAVILGKTVTTEFAYFSPGKTRHPLHPDTTPGGSSSGSAAAVGDGMVPVAFGSQTAGSLIRPASFCGIVGYKASHGEYSLSGIRPLAESLDSLGIMARSVADVQLVRQALLDRPAPQAAGAKAAPPRIGFYKTPHWDAVEPAERQAVEHAVEKLRAAGAAVESIAIPAAFPALDDDQRAVMAYETEHNYLFEYAHYPDVLSPQFRALCEQGRTVTRGAYLEALARVEAAKADFARLFAGFDAWLAPAALGEAPLASQGTGDPILSRSWTLLHATCVALPCGTGPRGLPLGLQLVAPKNMDDPLLETASWVASRLGSGT